MKQMMLSKISISTGLAYRSLLKSKSNLANLEKNLGAGGKKAVDAYNGLAKANGRIFTFQKKVAKSSSASEIGKGIKRYASNLFGFGK